MGLRGPGAKPKKLRTQLSQDQRSSADLASTITRKRNSLRQPSRFDELVYFVESLPITSGILAGKNFELRDWQKEILQKIYDGKGRRKVRQAVITMPRKNGKTQLAAALALAHLCGPMAESRGQVYSAASDRDQAALIYNEMVAIIKAVPDLDDRVIIRNYNRHLEDTVTGSIYKAISADVGTKHGFNASFVVFDELAQSPNRKLYDVLMTSMGGRKEPLFITISTQSADPHSIMSELVDYGQQVRDGVIDDPTFTATIYTAPEDSDPWNEATWFACNPALVSQSASRSRCAIYRLAGLASMRRQNRR